jgi:hypothetical protein
VALTTHPPTLAEVKEREDLYLYFASGRSWPLQVELYLFTNTYTPHSSVDVTTVDCDGRKGKRNIAVFLGYLNPFFCYLRRQSPTGCPTCYRTRHFFNNSNTNEDIATKQTHTTDTFFFTSYTTNVLLFKFCCNIFIGVGIIKEMPGSVASGTLCTFTTFSVDYDDSPKWLSLLRQSPRALFRMHSF